MRSGLIEDGKSPPKKMIFPVCCPVSPVLLLLDRKGSKEGSWLSPTWEAFELCAGMGRKDVSRSLLTFQFFFALGGSKQT